MLQGANARGGLLSAIKFSIDPYRVLVAVRGQEAADGAIREVAHVLIAAVRPDDLVVRLNAEHVGVVAPGLSIEDALVLADTMRARVARGAADANEHSLAAHRLTVSAGVDTLPAGAPGVATLMERAGKAPLRAKRRGRNTVAQFASTAAAIVPADQPSPADGHVGDRTAAAAVVDDAGPYWSNAGGWKTPLPRSLGRSTAAPARCTIGARRRACSRAPLRCSDRTARSDPSRSAGDRRHR